MAWTLDTSFTPHMGGDLQVPALMCDVKMGCIALTRSESGYSLEVWWGGEDNPNAIVEFDDDDMRGNRWQSVIDEAGLPTDARTAINASGCPDATLLQALQIKSESIGAPRVRPSTATVARGDYSDSRVPVMSYMEERVKEVIDPKGVYTLPADAVVELIQLCDDEQGVIRSEAVRRAFELGIQAGKNGSGRS